MDYSKENTVEIKKKGKQLTYLKFCLACGEYFTTSRMDKLTCDSACKQRLTYRLNRGLEPLVSRDMRVNPNDEILKQFGFKSTQRPNLKS